MTMNNANPNKPAAPNNQPGLSRAEREKRIADTEARRKAERDAAKAAATAAKTPTPGSREARVAEATAPGVVKPSKSDRPTKPPASANMTRPKASAPASEGDAKAGADAELDAAVRPRKPAKDPSMLTVGDVARELGIDPKRARARLRKEGRKATEGRWDKVRRGSPEHDQLVALLSLAESKAADAADAT